MLRETTSLVKNLWNQVTCSLNEAGNEIEMNIKTLKSLYNSLASLEEEGARRERELVILTEPTHEIAKVTNIFSNN